MVSADTSAPRSYSSRLRQEQAAATRERVVQAAAELFTENGYAGTTMPAIGRRAGVSTETVQNHGPKVELLRAAIASRSFGAEPGAEVLETELGRSILTAADPAAATAASAAVLALVNERSYGVWTALSEASRADPLLAAEQVRLAEEVAAQNGIVLESWRQRGWLRSDLSAAELVRRACAIGSVELWDRFVRVEGHDVEDYRRLVAGLLLDALTPGRATPTSFGATPGRRSMSEDLSRFRVEERVAQPYAYVSDDSVYMDRFDVIADRFGEVFAWLGQRGIEAVGPVFFRYNVINMPGPMHLEAGVPIAELVEGDDDVRAGELPAGRYVTVRHLGHPDSLMQATADLLAWAESEGLEFDQWDSPEGHAWASRTEWYYSDPVEVPDLNDWETELAFKLRP